MFPGALGDLICLGPAIRAIARRHSPAPVDLMARGDLANFAISRLAISEGHSIDLQFVSSLFRDEGPSDQAHLFFGRYHRVYSFFAHDDPRFSQNLQESTNGRVTFHPFRPPGIGHIAELYLASIEAAGQLLDARLRVTAQDSESAKRFLLRIGVDANRLILILPGSGSPGKNWPADRFNELACRLARETTPLVVLGPAEDDIGHMFDESGLLIGRGLSLETVAGLASMAAMFIGNDSGITHLAAAAGVPGLVIFGPTDPQRWRPIGEVAILRGKPIELIETRAAYDTVRGLLSSPRRIRK